jgi:uncharacterized lipoprotein NlpE involved in copper resistance
MGKLARAISCILVILILLTGCNKERNEAVKMRAVIKAVCINAIGANEYNFVYKNINDSIKDWIEHKLSYFGNFNTITKYRVDSLLCFNKKGNKCITTIFLQDTRGANGIETIECFNGVKIKAKWYYFMGSTLALPREMFERNTNKPLTFEKMEQLAYQHIYRNYLIKDADGIWVINEKYFDHFTESRLCTYCKTEEQWDYYFLEKSREIWNKYRNEH